MNGIDWETILLRTVTWAGLYGILAVARGWWEGALIARFQGRRAWPPLLPAPLPLRGAGEYLAGVLGLLAGAAVPLAPPVRLAGTTLAFHPVSGPIDAFYPLAAAWMGSVLLSAAARPDRWGRRPMQYSAARVLAGALPVLLAGLSLLITGGLLNPDREGTLHLASLIDLQGGWGGWRWLGVLQPLAAAVWMIGALPVQPGAQARTGLGWQLVLLAQALMTTAICWGGWQGPGVERLPWLGLVYTAVKLTGVTLVWSWLEVRLAEQSHIGWARALWPALVALGSVNLLLTGMVAVFQ